MSSRKLTVDAELKRLQRDTFGYFLHETIPVNGLVIDKTAADWPASTEDIYNSYAESFRDADHLRCVLEEAQTIADDALRELAGNEDRRA